MLHIFRMWYLLWCWAHNKEQLVWFRSTGHGADFPGLLPAINAGRARSRSGLRSHGKGHLPPALLRAPPEQGHHRAGWEIEIGLCSLVWGSSESPGGLFKKTDCCLRGSTPKVSNFKGLGWAPESAFLTISQVHKEDPVLGPPAFGKPFKGCCV